MVPLAGRANTLAEISWAEKQGELDRSYQHHRSYLTIRLLSVLQSCSYKYYQLLLWSVFEVIHNFLVRWRS